MTEPEYRLVRPARVAPRAPVLDDQQQLVVEHAGGPLLVLAGPGTGKTTTLVEAVVARVDTGVPISQILMLTFSRRAAGELRDRVTARLGGTVREPVARTLHSYAFGVLRMANVARGLPAPRLLAAAEQDIVLRELLVDGAGRWPASLRPAVATRAFAGELRDLLLRAVERGLDGRGLADLGRRRGRADWVAAGEFLEEYHAVTALQDPGGYDPAELIRAALAALADDPVLLARERAARRRIFVDEYQDTDPAQAELLALLARGADELVLVGDPDQSIYGFRGADDSALRDAPQRFGPMPTIALTTSRRSGATLLAATRRIAERLPGPAAQRALVPVRGAEPGRIDAGVFRSASEEAFFVASTLRRAHLDGVPWSRMAVLMRATGTTLPTLRRALTTAGVPVSVRGDELPLADQSAVAALLDVVQAVRAARRDPSVDAGGTRGSGDAGGTRGSGDAVATAESAESVESDLNQAALTEDGAEQLLLGPIGGGDAVYLHRLRRALRQLSAGTGDPATLAAAVWDPAGAAVLPAAVRRPIQRVATVLAAGAEAVAANGSAEDVLWAIWHGCGLARRWEQASRAGGSAGAAADRDLDAIVELFDAAARFTDRLPHSTIDGFAAHLLAQQIPGDTLAGRGRTSDTVVLLTAHASKGLEWDVVCVAGVQEGIWPDLRRRGSLLGTEALVDVLAGRDGAGVSLVAPQLAEERRLFYVAVTRARHRVVVTAVSGEQDQPSRFLDELDPVPDERPVLVAPRGVHLAGLIAELRSVVSDPAARRRERAAAATSLARLVHAAVPGADPDDWWGLAPLSDDRPVSDPDRPVIVSPSRIDAYLRCEVRALLTDLGARDGDQLSASLGVLVHSVAAAAPPDADPVALAAALERLLDAQWDTLDFGAAWFAANERSRARAMLVRLAAWLVESRRELNLVAVETQFGVDIGDAQLRGRVDRLERTADDRLVVIDYKTGKSKPKAEDLPRHPQLAAYQLAVERGGFGPGGSGGARLVQLGMGSSYVEQAQPPLAESADPSWIEDAVAAVAGRLRGSEFTARVGPDCRMCAVRSCCPLQSEGRQVTQ